MNGEVSIVIPFKGGWQYTHTLLFGIYSKCSNVKEVVLVDDCSMDKQIVDGVRWWQSLDTPFRVRYLVNEENKGYAEASNRGMALAEGDFLILMNNDIEVLGDFSKRVSDLLKEDTGRIIGGRILAHDTGWNAIQVAGHKMIVPYAEGWFIGCTNLMWKGLVGFDPLFYPYDFEDVDFSAKANHHGYELLPLGEDMVHHLTAKTYAYNDERRAMTENHQKKFKAKWERILNE